MWNPQLSSPFVGRGHGRRCGCTSRVIFTHWTWVFGVSCYFSILASLFVSELGPIVLHSPLKGSLFQPAAMQVNYHLGLLFVYDPPCPRWTLLCRRPVYLTTHACGRGLPYCLLASVDVSTVTGHAPGGCASHQEAGLLGPLLGKCSKTGTRAATEW